MFVNQVDKYQVIFNRAAIGMCVLDIDLHFMEVNDRICQILGYSRNSLLEMKCPTLLHPEDRGMIKSAYKKVLDGQKDSFSLRVRYRKNEETYIWTRFTLSISGDDSPELQKFIGVVEDINDLIFAEKALLKNEYRLSKFFDESGDLMHITDHEGKFTHVNKEELNILGYSKEELVGKYFLDVVHPDYQEAGRLLFDEIMQGNAVNKHNTVLKTKLGKSIFVEASVIPETYEGNIVGMMAILRDNTSLIQKSDELNATNKQLLEKNRELEQIVYVTSHDLRSPLVNIQGFNQELEMAIDELKKLIHKVDIPESLGGEIDLILNNEIPEAMDFVDIGIKKMDRLLKGLLSISRLGRRPLEIKKIDMNALVKEVLSNFEYRIKENEIAITVDELPSCNADELQLNQVFSNLVDNAIKYLDPDKAGRIWITGKRAQNRVVYEVIDNGIGIPTEKRDRVFEIFYRDEQSRMGEGLGLTLVRKIIEKHLGEVSIASNEHNGVTMQISMPIKQ